MPSQQKDMAHRNPKERNTWGARSCRCLSGALSVGRVSWPLLGAPITPGTHLPHSPYHMLPEAAMYHSVSPTTWRTLRVGTSALFLPHPCHLIWGLAQSRHQY